MPGDLLKLILTGMLTNHIFMRTTPLSAGVLLVFSLLYTPCVAAVASVKRELGTKWAVGMVFWQCLIAWVVAIITRGIGMLFF